MMTQGCSDYRFMNPSTDEGNEKVPIKRLRRKCHSLSRDDRSRLHLAEQRADFGSTYANRQLGGARGETYE